MTQRYARERSPILERPLPPPKRMSTTTLEKTDREFFDEAHELFCRECGYGVVVRREPPDCPMCRSNDWSSRPGFARWN